jgi:hypothetical protein
MSEWRWLVALEEALFFSVVCWETTASWAAPTYEPVPFALALVGAATVGMLTCHVGPAFYASRFAVPGWVMAWLAFGYLEWLWGMGEMSWYVLGWSALGGAVVCWRAAWRWVLGASLGIGVGVLGWALQAQWRGIWATNSYYGSGPHTLFSYFTPAVLLAAAPAMVIAWRIGKVRPGAQSVWWSGILGVWLPALVAVAVASVATDAGTTLYWQPSIPRGIQWALGGAEGITWTAVVLTCGTMVAPAILSLYALRELNEAWTGRRAMLLVPIGLWAAACAISQLIEPGAGFRFFFSTIHVWWAWGVVALGVAAGLRVLFLPVSGKMEYHRRDSA